uniref:Uncharacterized protein n=1 Tax=Helianthus annuus TaxID=4232 RepID=A0A251TLA7_HELAN
MSLSYLRRILHTIAPLSLPFISISIVTIVNISDNIVIVGTRVRYGCRSLNSSSSALSTLSSSSGSSESTAAAVRHHRLGGGRPCN